HDTITVGPLHELGEIARDFRLFEVQATREHFAGAAVERDPIALFDHVAVYGELSQALVDLHVAGAGHTTLAHAASHDSGVRRLPTPRGENPLGDIHAANVFRRSLGTDQN